MKTLCVFGFSILLLADPAFPQAPPDVPRFTVTTVAGTGERGFDGDGGPATKAKIQPPTAVALDRQGSLYIADERNQRIRKVTPDGVITTFMGTGRSKFQKRDLPASQTNIISAYGVATDHEDNLYVLSRGHNKILKVGPDGIARRIVGTGYPGYDGDGGPALEAKINFPNHLVVDLKGNLSFADTGNFRIRRVDPEGTITTIVGTGKRGFSGDGGPATKAEISAPAAMAIDREGSLYIADFSNHRIRKVTVDGTIQTIAGNGNPDYNGEGLPALEAQFGEPCGVAVDFDGYVYIGDQLNNRVRVVTPAGKVFTVAGTGIRGYSGDDGPAEKAQFSNPDIIAFDSKAEHLYVPDHINGVVRKLTRIR